MPMQLFLQLNSGDLPAEAGRPFGDGILQVFFCVNEETWCSNYEPFSKAALVRVVDRTAGSPQEIEVPPFADPFPERRIVSWTQAKDYPGYDDFAELCKEVEQDDLDACHESYPTKAGDKLLGWPMWIQGAEYPICPDCGEEMAYIFQIDSEANVPHMFGDSGCSHVTQCRKHRERVAIGWACY